MRQRTPQHADQLARARLAYLSAGQPPLTAPRHALEEPEPESIEPEPRAAVARPRLEFTRTHLVALATVALVAVVVVAFTWSRASAETVTTPAPVSVAASVPPPAAESPASPSAPPLRVHVLGGVESPGVVTVEPGAIVEDVIEAAGGLRGDAVPGDLNLAAPVGDGMQIVVGGVGETSRVEGQPTGPGGGASDGKIDLNTATREQLETLPGVGPVMAEAIVAWREQNGAFTSTGELQEVSGIGPKTFAKLEPLVTV